MRNKWKGSSISNRNGAERHSELTVDLMDDMSGRRAGHVIVPTTLIWSRAKDEPQPAPRPHSPVGTCGAWYTPNRHSPFPLPSKSLKPHTPRPCQSPALTHFPRVKRKKKKNKRRNPKPAARSRAPTRLRRRNPFSRLLILILLLELLNSTRRFLRQRAQLSGRLLCFCRWSARHLESSEDSWICCLGTVVKMLSWHLVEKMWFLWRWGFYIRLI